MKIKGTASQPKKKKRTFPWEFRCTKTAEMNKNAISDKLLLNDHQELIAFSMSANSLSTKTTFLESLGATTYACSYLNLAVRQLIKPLHLSKCMCVSGSGPCSWLSVFPAALITVLQPTWRPTSPGYAGGGEEAAMLLDTRSCLWVRRRVVRTTSVIVCTESTATTALMWKCSVCICFIRVIFYIY